MRRRCTFWLLALLLPLLIVSPGCKKSQPAASPADEVREPPPAPPPTPAPARPPSEDVARPGFEGEDAATRGEGFGQETISVSEMRDRLRTVYFSYDSYDLSPTTLQTLRDNAELLKAYSGYDVAVEGHCDERGTIDYNLALGEKRASSVRDYLVSLGVARDRIRIVTYGEERPVDSGHTEAAWSKNRRGDFVVEEGR